MALTSSFEALVVTKEKDGQFRRGIQELHILTISRMVTFLFRYTTSSLNYKDALSATGNKGVTHKFPHVPGIDAAGKVARSNTDRFAEGDEVLVTGYDLGQNTFGGFSRYVRVPADWVVPLPNQLPLRESMILGTAGFTAAIGVHHLRHNDITPNRGPVLVTGATGGVGSMAIAILAKLGYDVTAATGKMEQQAFLKEIGAASIIHRGEVQDESAKPLLSGRWAGAIETVGGIMLDTALRQTKHDGTVACCGNVLGHELHTNVYPFILRGIHLAGMDSGNCLMPLRKELWENLAEDWKPDRLDNMAKKMFTT
ncbi:MAG: YhdH/YhfP family quinone oxidoreductase [Fodinibius sp.]|nr:YhdH/YhfP family quinone oxidoreductase [Fodinibius sp.]